jgi:hypothetical protein
MEARGQLPQEKPKLLAVMDKYLNLPEHERINYTLGKRMGYYQHLDDMHNENLKELVEAKVREITNAYPDQLEEIFHELREQVV